MKHFKVLTDYLFLLFEDTRADKADDAPEPRNLVANRVIRDIKIFCSSCRYYKL